jgi:hypothetical protein
VQQGSHGAHQLLVPAPEATAPVVVRALLDGDVLALQRLTHQDVVHRGAQPEQPPGWAGLREVALTACATLPGASVELVATSGDTAVCRVTALLGRPGWASDATVSALVVLRFRDGLVAELWFSSDLADAGSAAA